MAKLDTKLKGNKNLDNKGNSKNFNKGKEPDEFAPENASYTNQIGGTSNPNGDKDKVYEKRMITPRDPVLNAVPMPNKKGKTVNYGVLSYTGDTMGKTAPANNVIGGTPKPNNIR